MGILSPKNSSLTWLWWAWNRLVVPVVHEFGWHSIGSGYDLESRAWVFRLARQRGELEFCSRCDF